LKSTWWGKRSSSSVKLGRGIELKDSQKRMPVKREVANINPNWDALKRFFKKKKVLKPGGERRS